MRDIAKLSLIATFFTIFFTQAFAQIEIKEYEGKKLSPYDRRYDNSIRGPQAIDIGRYKLLINGKVQQPLSLSYNEVIEFPSVTRAITLNCIEGWSEYLLFKGIRLVDLINKTNPNKDVKTVIFYAADGYSSSLDYKFIIENNIMIAYEINGKRLNPERGIPFQVIAESKYGYKWVKWLTHIELSDKQYEGYWEKRGYDNEANISNQ